MKILNCPLNGPRNISEFVWGGEVKPMPGPGAGSDRDWGAFVFLENNTAGGAGESHVPILVHRRAQHGDGRDRSHLSRRRAQRARRVRGQAEGRGGTR